MQIFVFVKQVMDTHAEVKLSAGKLDTRGVDFALSRLDHHAVEEAVKWKEKYKGTVTVVSVGTQRYNDALRNALSSGCDDAILLESDEYDDPLAIASAIASFLKDRKYDVLFFGRKSDDVGNEAVPGIVAGLLDLPLITGINKLKLAGKKVSAEKTIDEGTETVQASLPCVLAVEETINKVRFAAMTEVAKAMSKPLSSESASYENGLEVTGISLEEHARQAKILGKGKAAVPKLINVLKKEGVI